jgi:LPXTG-motif cell wall-anchored protein
MQTVGAGMLVLAATVAAPALSPAQQGADPNAQATEPPLTTPEPPPVTPSEPAPPEQPAPPADEAPASQEVTGVVPPQATATPVPKAAPQKKARLAASKTVSIGDNFYAPETVTINVGDTVTWNNDGAADHSATADDGSFDTGVFGGGQSRSETFTTAGTIPYYCTVHGQAQSGTVRVLAADGGGGGGGGSGASSSGTSEADAVASSGAAGSSSSLPATGFGAIFLAAVGFALVGSGSALRRRENAREAGRKRPARFFSF